jgi:multiple sugar transport system permease protein
VLSVLCSTGYIVSYRRYQQSLLLLLLPFGIGISVLLIIPALLAFGLAFTDYDGIRTPVWRGLENFQLINSDPLFHVALRNSLWLLVMTVPLRTLLALGLALLLSHPRRGISFYRAAVYLPSIVPGVAYALIWLWILNPLYGPLNALLQMFGLPTIAWLVDPATALPALALSTIFQIGESLVVLLAGLHEIPDDYRAAAAIDGAGRWAIFRHILLPLLMPWLLLVLMRDLIVSAQNILTPALVMTNGGPYYATLVLPLHIYQTAFEGLRFGEGAAMTLISFVGVGLLIALTHMLVGGWGYEDAV